MIKSVPGYLQQVLREEHIQGLQYLFPGRLAKGIEQDEGSLQRHGVAIGRESLQEFTLRFLQLPGVNVIKEIAGNVPIPAYSFWKGIYRLYNHLYVGHDAYLLGRNSSKGWWYYFPVAFAVKTPSAELALIVAAAALAFRVRGQLALPWYALCLPPAVYFAVSMMSSIDIGLRHILPVYPFLFITAAAILSRSRFGRAAALALACLLVIESLSAYPNYLPFFNFLAGGSKQGPRYLTDSNLDWGQDLKKLKTYLDRNSISAVCLDYFGSGEAVMYYRIGARQLSTWPPPQSCRVAAASVTALHFKDSKLKPLLACEPRARIGYSIYVYDLADDVCGAPAVEMRIKPADRESLRLAHR